jgi:hypothetical protein
LEPQISQIKYLPQRVTENTEIRINKKDKRKNPKHEIRNPKQIQNTNEANTKQLEKGKKLDSRLRGNDRKRWE